MIFTLSRLAVHSQSGGSSINNRHFFYRIKWQAFTCTQNTLPLPPSPTPSSLLLSRFLFIPSTKISNWLSLVVSLTKKRRHFFSSLRTLPQHAHTPSWGPSSARISPMSYQTHPIHPGKWLHNKGALFKRTLLHFLSDNHHCCDVCSRRRAPIP